MTALALNQSNQRHDWELKRLLRIQEALFRRTATDASEAEIEKDGGKAAKDKAESGSRQEETT